MLTADPVLDTLMDANRKTPNILGPKEVIKEVPSQIGKILCDYCNGEIIKTDFFCMTCGVKI
jgi:hypothetical protein